MAVDINRLVMVHIKPALIVDPTITEDLPVLIEAQLALQGWDTGTVTEQQKVYAAALTLEALMPRIALIYTDEVQEHIAGSETVKLPNRSEFFKALNRAIAALMKTSARAILGPDPDKLSAWPGCGMRRMFNDA